MMRASLSTDVPVLMLNQPINAYLTAYDNVETLIVLRVDAFNGEEICCP